MEAWRYGPPVLIGERILWLGSGSGIPQGGTVRWMGKLPEMGPSWTVGIELDSALPYGGIDGRWGGRHLFTCSPRHGLLVPLSSLLRESDVWPDRRRSVGVPPSSAYGAYSCVWPEPERIPFPRHSISGFPPPFQAVPYPADLLLGAQPSAPPAPSPTSPGTVPVQHPKPAVRRKNVSSFVQSLPLVEEETRQALYDTRDAIHADDAEVVEVAPPAAPPRFKNTLRRQSGDYSEYEWHDARDDISQDARRMVPIDSASGQQEVNRSKRERSGSGFFSFFKWFRKNKDDDGEHDLEEGFLRVKSAPSSPRLNRSRGSSCGSIDTVLSTATVSSFAFVSPTAYKNGPISPVQRRHVTAPDTDSYCKRIRQRDRRREAERNISLRKKYRLYGSDSTIRVSSDSLTVSAPDLQVPDVVVPTLRKKRPAPQPPDKRYSDYSLPTTLEHRRLDLSEAETLQIGRHRRTNSDGVGPRVHVRGKRRAPRPPTPIPPQEEATASNTDLADQSDVGKIPPPINIGAGISTIGRKKRPAPPPPIAPPPVENANLVEERIIESREKEEKAVESKKQKYETSDMRELDRPKVENNRLDKEQEKEERLKKDKSNREGGLSSEEREKLMNNISKLQSYAIAAPASPTPSPTPTPASGPSKCPQSPVSPRPWYKRSSSHSQRDSGGLKDIFKSLDKKNKDKEEDWMPESGVPRSSLGPLAESVASKFNIFARLTEDRNKKDKEGEKRRSQVSILANISELDRQAAQIVQEAHAREAALQAERDAKFYTPTPNPEEENPEMPRRNSAKELISLFNSISNLPVPQSPKDARREAKLNGNVMRHWSPGAGSPFARRKLAASNGTTSGAGGPLTEKSFKGVAPIAVIEADDEEYQTNGDVLANNIPSASTSKKENSASSLVQEPSNKTVVFAEIKSVSPTKAGGPLALPEPLAMAKRLTFWVCTRCTLENPRWRFTCDACGSWRPPEKRTLPGEPTPSPPAFIAHDSKVQEKAQEKQASAVGWENQVKQYFQKENKPPQPMEGEASKSKIDTPTTPEQQSTFIGGRLEQDEAKVRLRKNIKEAATTGEVLGSCDPGSKPNQLGVEEIRKARLEFFRHSASLDPTNEGDVLNVKDDVKSSRNNETIVHNGTEEVSERFKLIDMLKEMKDSLPKKRKLTETPQKNQPPVEVKGNSQIKYEEFKEDKGTGAIKKLLIENGIEKKRSREQNGKDNRVEAIFITTQTVEEDTKYKRELKPVKVSSSAQTSTSVVRKVEPSLDLKPSSSSQNIRPPVRFKHLPTTLEENATSIKDGVLYTSIRKESRRIGTGTFKLIGARDFANIEERIAPPLYVNIHPCSSQSDYPPTTSGNSSFEGSSSINESADFATPISTARSRTSDSSGLSSGSNALPRIGASPSSSARTASQSESGRTNGKATSPSSSSSGRLSRAPSSEAPSSAGQVSRAASEARSEASGISALSVVSESSEVDRLTQQLSVPQGIADFRAALDSAQDMNTLAVNRLLRRLETAISGGQHQEAARLARDLARLKISCSVIRQRNNQQPQESYISVDMYVEDKVSHQGPIPLKVQASMTVAQLREKVEREFELPAKVQRWILGKQLATDDSKTLQDHNVTEPSCPVFLYLVAPELEIDTSEGGEPTNIKEDEKVRNDVGQVPERARILPPPPPPRPGGGWYYVYEEDRYSFCEDSDYSDSEDETGATLPTPAPRIQSIPVAINQTPAQEPVDEAFKAPVPVPRRSQNEGNKTKASPSQNQAKAQAKIPAKLEPRHGETAAKSDHQPVAGPSGITEPTQQDIPNADGWRCPVCTLVNVVDRPGCVACSYDRPQDLEATKKSQDAERERRYQLLVDLDRQDLVPNLDPFDCVVCLAAHGAGDGVVLRECLHTFCRTCLINTVQFSEDAEVRCPYRDHQYACDSVLQEREIKALVPASMYEQHLAKSITLAENKIGNAFHCKTPDCRGWCIFEDNVNEFKCPVCNSTNCLTCQAIHTGVNCAQYQARVQVDAESNEDARRTQAMLQEMVARGEAMSCPSCQVVLMKKWGCDWLRCSMCKTEICWVTRKPRWGPGGKGDTSGGCQCGVNGVKCHPKCNFCH